MYQMAFWNFGIVFFFGVLWGLLELMLKFNDWRLIFLRNKKRKKKNENPNGSVLVDEYESIAGYVFWYLFLNGMISTLALYVIEIIAKDDLNKITSIEVVNILVAGFSGIAILRSSLMSISIRNKDIDIGLVNVAESLLSKIDVKINHNIAARRICEIYEIMKDVDFDKAKDELPVLCMCYIDYFPEEDQNKAIKAISSIDPGLDNINKSLQLGREIAKYCDVEILKRAVKKLPHIKVQNEKKSDGTDSETMDVFESRKLKLSEKWNPTEIN